MLSPCCHLPLLQDAFELMEDHLETMERRTAFSDVIFDLEVAAKSRSFKNRLNALHDGLYDKFIEAAQVATGEYNPVRKLTDWLDTWVNKILKSTNLAAVALKPITAIKQTLSIGYGGAMQNGNGWYYYEELSKKLVSPRASIKWAKENLPMMRERIKSFSAGNEKLSAGKGLRGVGKTFMWMNKSVDTNVASIVAHDTYDASRRKYLKQGYTSDRAHYNAIIDAEIAYNSTQQSAEGLFLSPAQRGKSAGWSAVTAFNNTNIGNTRIRAGGARDIALSASAMLCTGMG